MKRILETDRMYLREFTINDAQLLIDLNSDYQVTRYTGDIAVKDLTEAERILNEIIFPQYANKLGRWAVHLKSTNEFIGWCGLKYIAEKDEIDLGYRFFKKHWNKGYASESAIAAVNYGITVLKLEVIYGTAAVENSASIKVLKKVGMVYHSNDNCHNDKAEKYIYKK